MKKVLITTLITTLAILLCTFGVAFADCTVTLEWTANTEPDLAGYRMFTHYEGGAYNYAIPVWDGTETTCQVDVLYGDTHYFVVRAYDTEGLESVDSNEVSQYFTDPYINIAPGAPTGLGIIEVTCD